jgi:phosphatidylethanolamine-binding protein (PEBP) family uncharacterized protein
MEDLHPPVQRATAANDLIQPSATIDDPDVPRSRAFHWVIRGAAAAAAYG